MAVTLPGICERIVKAGDFPAIFGAADAAANSAQRGYLAVHRWNSWLLICAAALALASRMTTVLAILSAVLFLASLATYIYGQYQRFQERWYQARALAESVKTATWRLMMMADPFS